MTQSFVLPEEYYEADLEIARLFRGEALQVRELQKHGNIKVRPDIVDDYLKLYKDGRDLGPFVVVEEVDAEGEPTGRLLLADGYHRSEARLLLAQRDTAQAAKWNTVRCRVYKGDTFTAILLAAKENGGRGLQFGLADRKKVAELMLIGLAKRGVTWSDERIGAWAGIDSDTVAGVRKDVNSRYTLPTAREVLTSDGRSYIMNPRPHNKPAAYQPDALLDNMPLADTYVERPASAAPAYPPRSRATNPTGPRGSGDYRPPIQPTAYRAPQPEPARRWDQELEEREDDGLPEATQHAVPAAVAYATNGHAAIVEVDEEISYTFSWSRVGPNGQPEYGTVDQDTIRTLAESIKARLRRDLDM